MKIAFIGQKGLPAIGGGVEKYVEDLTAALVKDGREIFVYTRRHYTDKSLTVINDVNLIGLPSINTKHLDAISHTLLASIHAAYQNFDVIHYQSIGPALLCWLPKLLNRRVKIVATLQSRDYEHQKWGMVAQWFLKLGERLMCLFADEIVVVTKNTQDYVLAKYGRQAAFITNGAKIYDYPGADLIGKWQLTADNYIVAVSRLIRHKGLGYLIQAYRQLATDKKLVIVGDGAFSDDYVKELKTLAGADDRIIFTGNQTGEALAQLYANAFLFVQPSESEGLSLALLEAMARGRAVLVSDITENIFAVGEAGFSFANKNTVDLTERLAWILANEQSAKAKGLAARERARTHFNWDAIAGKMVDLYNQTERATVKVGRLRAVGV